jgi:hypothetical protein
MKVKYILIGILLLMIFSCSEQHGLKNNRVYEIWSTIHISWSDDYAGQKDCHEGLSPDYDLIKKLSLPCRKIIAYYTTRAGYISSCKDVFLAEVLGQYATLTEARNSLLKDWKHHEILAEKTYIHTLFLMKSENKIITLLPTTEPDLRCAHIFQIDKENEIIYLGRYENIKYNPPYDETVKINLKTIPEDTLFAFDTNEAGENRYITQIRKDDTFKGIGNGDYYIYYEMITGDYPKSYNKLMFYLHVIPENNIFKFETMLTGFYIFENKKMKKHMDPDGKWVFSGYSADTGNLYVKIHEYYLRTK